MRPGIKAAAGVSVAIVPAVFIATAPVSTVVPWRRVKVAIVNVAAFIGLLNVAVTSVLSATFAASDVGVVDVTIGRTPTGPSVGASVLPSERASSLPSVPASSPSLNSTTWRPHADAQAMMAMTRLDFSGLIWGSRQRPW